MMNHRILRLPDVQEITGLKRTAIYDKMKIGEFPSSISLSERMVGWIESEVQAWLDDKINQTRLSVRVSR